MSFTSLCQATFGSFWYGGLSLLSDLSWGLAVLAVVWWGVKTPKRSTEKQPLLETGTHEVSEGISEEANVDDRLYRSSYYINRQSKARN